ncbi:uncharacterized protein YunC (DUF1805 family) [Clostridiales Family XIII bacterium PM5-7]
MFEIELLTVNGQNVQGMRMVSPGGEGHPNLIVIQCKNGYVMCGYLNQAAAESFGDAAAIVGGSCFAETLANPVKAVTTQAANLGVTVGMTGAEAIAKLNA